MGVVLFVITPGADREYKKKGRFSQSSPFALLLTFKLNIMDALDISLILLGCSLVLLRSSRVPLSRSSG